MEPALADYFQRIEAEMFTPEVCQSRIELESRYAVDFVEVTAGGKSYNREEIIKLLLDMAPAEVTIENFAARHLAPEVVLLTYRSHVNQPDGGASSSAIRATIWRLENSRWVADYHQATSTQ